MIPKFPVEDFDEITKIGKKFIAKNQTPDTWLGVFGKYLPEIRKNKHICFVGHSLGPLFIAKIIDKYNINLEGAIFVAPFLKKINTVWQADLNNNEFYKLDINFKKVVNNIQKSYALYSDNDPYVPVSRSIDFAKKLNSSLILVKSGGHMNKKAGFNKFVLVFELCKAISGDCP